jgi:hypothetical protein
VIVCDSARTGKEDVAAYFPVFFSCVRKKSCKSHSGEPVPYLRKLTDTFQIKADPYHGFNYRNGGGKGKDKYSGKNSEMKDDR